jgi:hypothetical protein
MARQIIDMTTVQPNGKKGEPATTAFGKINNSLAEVYAALGGDTLPTALPVAKGGTGATTAAAARTALGIGSVAVENTVPISKGGTGATTGLAAIKALGGLALNNPNGSVGTRLVSGAPPNIASISSTGNDYNTALNIGNSSNDAASAVISFLRDGKFGCHLGIDTDNVFKVGGWSFGANSFKIYHEGNTTRAADGTLKAV